MIGLFLATFFLPSLLVYILIKTLRGEAFFSKCQDDVFVMTLIYPIGFAFIIIQCLAKLSSNEYKRIKRSGGAQIVNFPKLRDI